MKLIRMLILGVAAFGFCNSSDAVERVAQTLDYTTLPVIPDIALVRATSRQPAQSVTAMDQLANCPQLYGFGTTSPVVGIYFDSARLVTELYIGDYFGNRILRHDITASLARSTVPLPIPYGIVFVARDLDKDGELEIVIQSGDAGLGGDGWLDIRSATDWRIRSHFVFPAMKVYMHPVPIDIDGDPETELFVTPTGFGGPGYALIIDYEPLFDSFYIRSQILGPESMGGDPAVADFDDDGRLEMFKGTPQGYALFEWQDTALALVDMLCDSCSGNFLGATVCQPRADGRAYALLGNNDGQGDYHYDLMLATGDNQFTMVHTFFEPQLAWGITPCGAADVDCDGLDELVMLLPPYSKTWEWSEDSCKYVPICSWANNAYGTINYWQPVDLNQNAVSEFGGADDNVFRSFPGSPPIICDTLPSCPPPPTCECPCEGDPECDSIVTNIQDVVRTLDVAFRSGIENWDAVCPYSRTDVNCDLATTVTDVVRVINVAFRGASSISEFCVSCIPN